MKTDDIRERDNKFSILLGSMNPFCDGTQEVKARNTLMGLLWLNE